MTTNKLLRIRDVADRLQVTTQYIYLLVKQGKLRSVSVGERSMRIPEDGLNEYLKKVGGNDDENEKS